MATQYAKAEYQEVIDLHTEADHVTIIGIHTPTGNTPRKMFSGFFNQFKKFRYLGASIKLVPAARLPADPLQVSYEPGQVLGTNVDPRDMLNPLMFHGTHGEDMGIVLNRLFGDDIPLSEATNILDEPSGGSVWEEWLKMSLEKVYYKALTDNTWKKANPQRGFMKSGLRPMVYSLATNRQIMPGSKGEVIGLGANNSMELELGDPTSDLGTDFDTDINVTNLQVFTPRLTSLGWIDTRNELTATQDSTDVGIGDGMNFEQINYTLLPKIYMGVIMLPPAYGVEQYFRMIINHYFAFKGFRGISFKPEIGSVPSYYNANDIDDVEQYGGEDHIDGNVIPNEDGSGDDSGGGDDPTPEPEPTKYTVTANFVLEDLLNEEPLSGATFTFKIGSNSYVTNSSNAQGRCACIMQLEAGSYRIIPVSSSGGNVDTSNYWDINITGNATVGPYEIYVGY